MEIKDSFKNAFDSAPHNERSAIRKEIMDALGIKSVLAFRRRMIGNIEHTRREASEIEKVFHAHGVKKVWG